MQLLNALSPMDSTDDGISKVEIEVQSENAPLPIDLTVGGRWTEAKDLHPEKVPTSTDSTCDISTDANEVHPENASSPISFTDGGMFTDANEVHPRNARSPMDFTEDGTSKDSSDLQPENARALMYFTVSGRVILVILLQSRNMSLSTRAVPFGSS